MPNLQLVGLMTMAPLEESEKKVRQAFARTREIFEEMRWHKIGGANLRHGFRRLVTDRLGGVHGCTHLTEVVGTLPTLAVQMFAGLVREIEGTDKPFQLDRCQALDTRSETVRRYYPQWYRGAA
jgi:hypothetical protein